MFKPLTLALLLASTPALAATPPDRDTAITTLATFYFSADVCGFSISRAKVDAYREANKPADDALFNVDVFRATQALYAGHKDDTDAQTKTFCQAALKVATDNAVLL